MPWLYRGEQGDAHASSFGAWAFLYKKVELIVIRVKIYMKGVKVKITLSGSIHFLEEMIKVREKLGSYKCDVFVPMPEEDALIGNGQSIETKFNIMKDHFDTIYHSDGILVLNYDKDGIKNYIGTNTLIELGVAFFLKKKIFILNELPKMALTDEVAAMKPIILGGKLENIKEYL